MSAAPPAGGGESPPWADDDPVGCLISTRGRRLARLARVLRAGGIDLEGGFRRPDPWTLANALDDWCASAWKPVARREWVVVERWWNPASHVHGATSGIYTHLVDMGIALGEIVVRQPAGWAWEIDRYAAHCADGHESFGRLVVLHPEVARDAPYPVVFDAFDTVFMRLQSLAYGSIRTSYADALRPCQPAAPFHCR
jgi:hypothetical protein